MSDISTAAEKIFCHWCSDDVACVDKTPSNLYETGHGLRVANKKLAGGSVTTWQEKCGALGMTFN